MSVIRNSYPNGDFGFIFLAMELEKGYAYPV